jgi:TolB protein
VSVGWNGTDPSRYVDSWAVIDVRDGKQVSLPVTGQIENIDFNADGQVLVRTKDRQLIQLDSEFKQVAKVSEPAELANARLIGYAK